jgi:hypothetical protein
MVGNPLADRVLQRPGLDFLKPPSDSHKNNPSQIVKKGCLLSGSVNCRQRQSPLQRWIGKLPTRLSFLRYGDIVLISGRSRNLSRYIVCLSFRADQGIYCLCSNAPTRPSLHIPAAQGLVYVQWF